MVYFAIKNFDNSWSEWWWSFKTRIVNLFLFSIIFKLLLDHDLDRWHYNWQIPYFQLCSFCSLNHTSHYVLASSAWRSVLEYRRRDNVSFWTRRGFCSWWWGRGTFPLLNSSIVWSICHKCSEIMSYSLSNKLRCLVTTWQVRFDFFGCPLVEWLKRIHNNHHLVNLQIKKEK